MISEIVNNLFGIYWWLIILRIFLTWIPTVKWESQPFSFLKNIVDPVLLPFRSIIPPIGGLDLSPIIALLFLQFVRAAILQLLYHFGL